MTNQLKEIRAQVRSVNRRLYKNRADPSNADRALWGQLAVLTFAGVTGQSEDVLLDPETTLGDLLADFMHWCSAQKTNPRLIEPIDFESALRRARLHYDEECADSQDEV